MISLINRCVDSLSAYCNSECSPLEVDKLHRSPTGSEDEIELVRQSMLRVIMSNSGRASSHSGSHSLSPRPLNSRDTDESASEKLPGTANTGVNICHSRELWGLVDTSTCLTESHGRRRFHSESSYISVSETFQVTRRVGKFNFTILQSSLQCNM